MIKRLVREIAFMVVLTILGATDLILALASSKWWVGVMDIVGAILAFFVAWLSYRDARKIAEVLDEPVAELHVIAFSSKVPAEAKAAEEIADSEDPANFGHPV